MLEHLGTEAAADALAGAFVTGDFDSAPELTSALFTSPHRFRIVTALEAALRDPAIGIDEELLSTIAALVASAETGSRFASDAADRRWSEAAGRARALYKERLAAALPLKTIRVRGREGARV